MADMQNGGWYNGRQYWNGQLGAPGQIINPNQQGNSDSSSSNNNSSNNSSPSVSSFNPVDFAKQMLDFQKQQNQPVIQSLQSQIPTTQALYAQKGSALSGQMDPLKQRYESALNALTAGSQVAVQTAQTSASREFGARGVPLSSSAYDQYLQGQVNPIASSYAGYYGNLRADEADAIKQLQDEIAQNPLLSKQAVDAINTQIAQLQAGNSGDAITQALQMYNLQNTASNNAADIALRNKTADAQIAAAKSPKTEYATLGEGQTLYNLLTGQAQYTAPKTYATKGGNSPLPDLEALFE
jgi:hypothetical protein